MSGLTDPSAQDKYLHLARTLLAMRKALADYEPQGSEQLRVVGGRRAGRVGFEKALQRRSS